MGEIVAAYSEEKYLTRENRISKDGTSSSHAGQQLLDKMGDYAGETWKMSKKPDGEKEVTGKNCRRMNLKNNTKITRENK